MIAALSLEQVGLRLGGTSVLRNVSLAAQPGEVIALLGPSGSGKSSLLRVVAGLYRPDEGRVLIDGKDVTTIPPAGRDTAMVFQSFALYPHLTVAGNIATPLRLSRLAWWMRLPGASLVSRSVRDRTEGIRQDVDSAARLARIDTLLDRKPAQLSGGQRQRAAIARALVRNPKAFLLDEPLSSLDARLREATLEDIHHLQRRLAVTTLFVTHDQAEALAIADRIAVMFDGRIAQIGTPSDVYLSPATRDVAAFLGTPSINFAPAAVLASYMELPRDAFEVAVRPQDLRIVPLADHPAAMLTGIVERVVPNGSEVTLSLRVPGIETLWRATLPVQFAPVLERAIGLQLDPRHVHVFDASGRRLGMPAADDRTNVRVLGRSP